MQMIPQTTGVNIKKHTDRTYRYSYSQKRFISYTDGIEAVKQAVYFILSTERYDYIMYSPNYGIEMKDLIGAQKELIICELPRRIREALLCDDRIKSVDDFEFSSDGNALRAAFKISTVYGDFEEEYNV